MDITERLTKLAIFYDGEARRCAKSRAYFAASVLQAAALEAMLHSMCSLYPEQVKKTIVYKGWKFKTKRNSFLEFKFVHLIKIARELKWVSVPISPLDEVEESSHGVPTTFLVDT